MDGQTGNGSNGAYIPQEGEYAGSSPDSELYVTGGWVDVDPAPASSLWAAAGSIQASELRTPSTANEHGVVLRDHEGLRGISGNNRTARERRTTAFRAFCDSFHQWWTACSTNYLNTLATLNTHSHADISQHFLADVSMQHFCQTVELIAGELSKDMPDIAALDGYEILEQEGGKAFIRAWNNRTQWQFAPDDTTQTQ